MSVKFSNLKKAIGLDDELTFGKHIGERVIDLVRSNPDYLAYLIDNTDIKFYESVHQELESTRPKVKPKKVWFYDKGLHGDIAHFEAEQNQFLDDWDSDVPF